jgi:tRNA threonylcarbamoyladenosine biosynthesis protein TsaB
MVRVRVLSIETSGPVGGVALLEGDAVLEERLFGKGMVHGRDLAPAVERLWAAHGRALDLVAVDIGPGSYTGLRVGLAAAKGLCLALGVPILGVVSLDAMAEAARGQAPVLCPVLDAKWDQFYGAIYAPHRVSELLAEKPEEFARRVPADAVVFGGALPKYAALFAPRRTLGAEFAQPRPSVVARLAARDFAAGRRDDARTLVPLYLRKTEAEIKFGT